MEKVNEKVNEIYGTPECAICFSEAPKHIKCIDSECKTAICYDCAKMYVVESHEANLIPRCPRLGNGKDCDNFYLISSIKKLDKESITMYQKSCFNYFMKRNRTDIQDDVVYTNMLKQLRKDRLAFIQKEFPASVALVVSIALKRKLNSIAKKNQAIKKKVKSASRSCMISYCDGKLDSEMVCIKCETSFCKRCEKMLLDGHKCKIEDIESVSFVNALIRCPKCKLPVQKKDGCRSITCAVCGTNFDYYTGEECAAGNHGKSIMISIRNYNILSNIYKEFYNTWTITVLRDIESKKPGVVTMDPVINILKKIYKMTDKDKNDKDVDEENDNKVVINAADEIDDLFALGDEKEKEVVDDKKVADDKNQKQINKLIIELATRFETYILKKHKYKHFVKIYSSIEKLHEGGKLTEEQLLVLLGKL